MLAGMQRAPSEESVLPELRLFVSKVEIQSPVILEIVGVLNPLETIRRYLNDRDERRKDKEYREAADRRKRDLENESLLNKVLAARVQILRDLGFTKKQIRQRIWGESGEALARLGDHQDSNLISTGELIELPSKDVNAD